MKSPEEIPEVTTLKYDEYYEKSKRELVNNMNMKRKCLVKVNALIMIYGKEIVKIIRTTACPYTKILREI